MNDEPRTGDRWTGWLVPGAVLLVAVVLLVLTLRPAGEPEASPSRQPSAPTPTPADEHAVVTEDGVVTFMSEGGSIVVRLTSGGSTAELGRTTMEGFTSVPPSGTPAPTGTAMFLLVCPREDGSPPRRYVFGHLDGSGATYAGPSAVGQSASDGLFLFALVPGTPAGPVNITGSDGSSAGFGPGALDHAVEEGERQPSGCYLVG